MPQLKDIAFWDWAYLSELPEGEHDWIDYKDSRFLEKNESAWLAEISEYLSAFSNYDGGYVLIGITKQFDGKHTPDQGVLLRTPKIKDWKEWLEDKLPAQADPPLNRIAVTTIPSPSDKGRGVIVIYVPESSDAPHQGHNERFYVRTGSKNRALKTRQIFDIRGRKKHPNIRAEVRITIDNTPPHASILHFTTHNESDVLCAHCGAQIEIPTKYKGWDFNLNNDSILNIEKGAWILTLSPEGPVFPRSSPCRYVEFTCDYEPLFTMNPSNILKARVFADAAPYRDFEFSMADVVQAFDPLE